MARGRNQHPAQQRDLLTDIARPIRLLAPIAPSPMVSPLVEDRRLYHPLGDYRPALTIDGARTSIVPATPAPKSNGRPRATIPYGVAFSQPDDVNICRRRKTRREVIFAKKLRRKGSGAKSRRRNIFSEVSC